MRTWARVFLLVLLIALLPALAALDSRSFFSPDETNYTQVAREMLETGDMVVPHRDGEPWFNKPPLAYWLLAAWFWALGWGFPAAVLLNTTLTALTALAVALHVARTSGRGAAMATAVAYLTMALPMAAARTALTDPTLVLASTAAVVLFLSEGRGSSLAAGACLGLGVLAKGPIAPLVVLPAMATAAFLRRSDGGLQRLLAALTAAAAVVAPWQAGLVLRGAWPAWAAEFLGQEVVSRATDRWRIAGPWWYYAPALWVAAFPWGTHLIAALRTWRRHAAGSRWRDPTLLAEMAAVATPVLAFSLATNKLPHYILPVMPFLAVWLGRACQESCSRVRDSISRRTAWLATVLGSSFLVALGVLSETTRASRFLPSGTAWVLMGAALAFALLGSLEASGRARAGWLGLAVLALVLRLGLDISLVPHIDRQLPERPLAEAIARHLPPNGLPVAYRWWRTAFLTYGVRGWTVTDSVEALQHAIAAGREAGRPVLLVVRTDSEGEARSVAWNAGGEAQEVARVSGLGEINGEVIEGIVFRIAHERSGKRWFYDADRPLPEEAGFSAVETSAWTTDFRWSVEGRTRLVIPASLPGPAMLRLRAWGLAAGQEAQRARPSINGCALPDLPLDREGQVLARPVDWDCLQPDRQELVLEAAHLVIPADVDPTSHDRRTLGIAIDWLALDPVSSDVLVLVPPAPAPQG